MAELVNQTEIISGGVAAIHEFEDSIRAGLEWKVNKTINFGVGGNFFDQFVPKVPGVAGKKLDFTDAGSARDFLEETDKRRKILGVKVLGFVGGDVIERRN